MVGVGCGGGAELPPPQQPQAQQAAQAAPADQGAEMAAAVARSNYDGVQAQLAQVQMRQAIGSAALQRQTDQEAAVAAQREKEREDECAKTRPSRVASAREAIREWAAMMAPIDKHRAWIVANCTQSDTRALLVDRLPNGSLRIRRDGEVDAIRCKGQRPAGVTDDGLRMRFAIQDHPEILQTPLQPAGTCEPFDTKVGLKLDVTPSDEAGMLKVLRWAP